jgi:hypothetical protein
MSAITSSSMALSIFALAAVSSIFVDFTFFAGAWNKLVAPASPVALSSWLHKSWFRSFAFADRFLEIDAVVAKWCLVFFCVVPFLDPILTRGKKFCRRSWNYGFFAAWNVARRSFLPPVPISALNSCIMASVTARYTSPTHSLNVAHPVSPSDSSQKASLEATGHAVLATQADLNVFLTERKLEEDRANVNGTSMKRKKRDEEDEEDGGEDDEEEWFRGITCGGLKSRREKRISKGGFCEEWVPPSLLWSIFLIQPRIIDFIASVCAQK